MLVKKSHHQKKKSNHQKCFFSANTRERERERKVIDNQR
jgi:hypothetical protein